MTMIELLELHDRFLSGASGNCALCGADGARAWLDREEIDAGPASRHDTWHFLWLGAAQEDRPQGFICDACIDRLEVEGRIEAYCNDMSGPRADLSEAAAAVAYELGARHMRTILDLPVDAHGVVSPDALAALPPALCRRRNRPVPLWELLAAFAGRAAPDDDPEGAGRRHSLAKAAVGISIDTDLSEQARDWARGRAERRTRDREVNDLIRREVESLASSGQPVEHQSSDPAAQSNPETSLWERLRPLREAMKGTGRPLRRHPDSHELDDWNLYGPKSGKIFGLVERLAYEHDMRVFDIDRLIEEALQRKLDELKTGR